MVSFVYIVIQLFIGAPIWYATWARYGTSVTAALFVACVAISVASAMHARPPR